jgi:hypothetical protein
LLRLKRSSAHLAFSGFSIGEQATGGAAYFLALLFFLRLGHVSAAVLANNGFWLDFFGTEWAKALCLWQNACRCGGLCCGKPDNEQRYGAQQQAQEKPRPSAPILAGGDKSCAEGADKPENEPAHLLPPMES